MGAIPCWLLGGRGVRLTPRASGRGNQAVTDAANICVPSHERRSGDGLGAWVSGNERPSYSHLREVRPPRPCHSGQSRHCGRAPTQDPSNFQWNLHYPRGTGRCLVWSPAALHARDVAVIGVAWGNVLDGREWLLTSFSTRGLDPSKQSHLSSLACLHNKDVRQWSLIHSFIVASTHFCLSDVLAVWEASIMLVGVY
jgi:hypothetical protein